jgi:hypothetical protein
MQAAATHGVFKEVIVISNLAKSWQNPLQGKDASASLTFYEICRWQTLQTIRLPVWPIQAGVSVQIKAPVQPKRERKYRPAYCSWTLHPFAIYNISYQSNYTIFPRQKHCLSMDCRKRVYLFRFTYLLQASMPPFRWETRS